MATARNDYGLEAFPVRDSAMRNLETGRERAANHLAERLFFELEKQGNRYLLCRKIGDHARRDNLSLDEVEHLLEGWKLEGPHGG